MFFILNLCIVLSYIVFLPFIICFLFKGHTYGVISNNLTFFLLYFAIIQTLVKQKKTQILEFLRIINRTSDFEVLNIINNISKTMQNLQFWSFCGGRKTPILEFLRIIHRTSDFRVLNNINNIFKTLQNLRFWSIKYYQYISKTTQNLQFWSF